MAFTGDGRKLTGVDGTIYTGVFETELTTGTLDPGYYVITGIAATSGFPAVSGATGAVGIRVGDLLKVQTSDTVTLGTGDSVYPVTLTEMCDIQSWNLPFTADEIETTTFCDNIKTYEKGKADAAGSLTGITTIGTTTDPGGILNQFIDTIKQDGDTSYDVHVQDSSILFAYLVANKTESKGDEIAVFLPVNIYGAGIGGDQGSAQTFDSSFRIASYDGVNPALYRFALDA